jgi:hypothetical protein
VIIGGKTWPKDRRWIIAICIASLVTVAAYAAEWASDGRLPGGGSRTGLAAGIVGGLIIGFELLLWPRKRVRSWRLGSAQSWLRAHIWLGILAVPLVLMHARLLFIGGLLNWALMLLFFMVIASGIWGLVLQQYLPQAILDHVPAETIYEQIGHVARQQCRDVEKIVDAMCEHDPAGHAADNASRHGPPDDEDEDDADDDEHAVITGFRSMTGIQGKVVETLALYAPIPGTLPIRRAFVAEIRPYLLDGAASGAVIAQPHAAARRVAARQARQAQVAGDAAAARDGSGRRRGRAAAHGLARVRAAAAAEQADPHAGAARALGRAGRLGRDAARPRSQITRKHRGARRPSRGARERQGKEPAGRLSRLASDQRAVAPRRADSRARARTAAMARKGGGLSCLGWSVVSRRVAPRLSGCCASTAALRARDRRRRIRPARPGAASSR